MILILSDNSDKSTDQVIDWLYYYKLDFMRVTAKSKVQVEFIDLENFLFSILIDEKRVESENISGYWYRRDEIKFEFKESSFNSKNMKLLRENAKMDYGILRNFLTFMLEKKSKKIGSFFNVELNKLVQLNLAKEIGLKIPSSFVVNNFDKLPNSTYITKGFSQVFGYKGNYLVKNYTTLIDKENTKDFSFGFVQENLEKIFEVRTFFLNDKTFSMAIFSQKNSKTKIDFRNYDNDFPNRNVPYNLPFDVEKKLIRFMNSIKLNTGSIDFVVNSKNEHVFLEVNPIGQFGMVSYPCNYHLEKLIADFYYGIKKT
jgi:ATP-GRASP peptide maturase of grasp-with-spasm system